MIFFAKNAELVLAEELKLYQDSKDIKKLINSIIYSDNKQFARIFKNTAVAGIVSNNAPETSSGIQATIGKTLLLYNIYILMVILVLEDGLVIQLKQVGYL